MAIYVNNLQAEVDIPGGVEELLARAARAVLERAGRSGAEAGITLADDSYLRELNRNYRGVDEPTDVLSFALRERQEDEPAHEEAGPELLGDVVISAPRAAAQAEEYGHPLQRELAFLAVHGLLHLLGHDHDQDDGAQSMRALEEAILTELGWERGREAAKEHH